MILLFIGLFFDFINKSFFAQLLLKKKRKKLKNKNTCQGRIAEVKGPQ